MEPSRISIKEAQRCPGKRVRLAGHIHAIRNLGKVCFVHLRDFSGIMQLVATADELLAKLGSVSLEVPIIAEGVLVENTSSRKGLELQLEYFETVSGSQGVPPIELAKNKIVEALSTATLLDYRPLSLRNPRVRAIFKIEAEIVKAFRQFLTGENFVEIHSPKIVATSTEGGARVFSLDYFGRSAYLAQSPQFYKQIMVGVFERVFEVGPVYRAEEHDTTRHLNEYISLDFEMGFIHSEMELVSLQEKLIAHILLSVSENCAEELALFELGPQLLRGEIPKISFAEAIRLLEQKLGWRAGPECADLDPEGERLICEHFAKECNSEFVYILHYPLAVRPFYTMPLDASASQPLARGFDLLYRGLEITTGGQRIHEYGQLIAAIEERGLKAEDFADYLQCFKYGMPPHGGLAIGLERFAKQLLNLRSVKQASLFPRDRHRFRP